MLYVLDGIAETSNTVGQQTSELIRRNDYHTDINVAVLEIIADVGIGFC